MPVWLKGKHFGPDRTAHHVCEAVDRVDRVSDRGDQIIYHSGVHCFDRRRRFYDPEGLEK